MPQRRAYAFLAAGANVLGDEGVDVRGDPHEEGDEDEARHTGGKGSGYGIGGVPRQEDAVDEVLNTPGSRAQDEGYGHAQEVAIPTLLPPPVAQSANHDGATVAEAFRILTFVRSYTTPFLD